MNHPTLLDTLNLVIEYHSKTNNLDKGGQTPYYWHLLRVMLRIKTNDENLKHIALLHDVIEDTPLTIQDLKNLGYNSVIVEGVFWSSKNMFPELSFSQWMKKIGEEAPVETIILKIADISDNLGFERMNGLKHRIVNPEKIKKSQSKKTNLQNIIDKKVGKGMRLHGEMGVFTRYYDGWNFIMENPKNIQYIEQVYTEDFCNFSQLKELSKWIPQEEMLNYLSLNRINTWKISGVLEHSYDSNNKYLSVHVEKSDVLCIQNFVCDNINSEAVYNQKERDSNNFHITVINTAQYGSLLKHNSPLNKIESYLGKKIDFFIYGIGTATKDNNQAWFLILDNPILNTMREDLGLFKWDFHVTLGFKDKDFHRVPKSKDTVIFSNNDIWNYLVSNELYNENQNKNTLKKMF